MQLETMYPAAANSKATTTVGALNADTTTITVLDGTVLPEAPNLLVLGTDQTAETVLMTGKDGNVLTVERGFQGVAKAWNAGTEVARNFTAYDADTMKANIEGMAAEMGTIADTMAKESSLQTFRQESKAASDKILAYLKDKTMARYGIRINKNEPDPAARVEYLYEAVGMKPAKMNYVTGQFDYGDWANVWFVKENYPVMVKFNGEEDYRLDKNDMTKRVNGAASDIANSGYGGNAMSAIPLVWIARWEEGNYEYISVCQSQYDETYRADAHTKEDGSIMDKYYMACYRGALVDTKLRSLSGLQPMHSKTAQQEIDYAKANGELWDTDSYSRYNLIADLMTIMAKTEDSQAAYGNGNLNYQEDLTPTHGVMQTGTLNDKGQFWGMNDNTHQMKAFYIEAVYADQWRRVRGLIYDHGIIKIKPTAPYNLTGEGYYSTGVHLLNASGEAQSGENNHGWISGTKMTKYGRLPVQLGGSSATYTCDYCWSRDDIVAVGLVGADCSSYEGCGVRAAALNNMADWSNWHYGAALSSFLLLCIIVLSIPQRLLKINSTRRAA